MFLTIIFSTLITAATTATITTTPSRHTIATKARCGSCQALFSELTMEVLRHNLHEKGEEEILDSVEAACLGVVQNYTIIKRPPWVIFAPEVERMNALGKNDGAHNNDNNDNIKKENNMADMMYNALLMKDICADTGEHIGMEMSEGVWREVRRQMKTKNTHTNLTKQALQFCHTLEESGCKTKEKAARRSAGKKKSSNIRIKKEVKQDHTSSSTTGTDTSSSSSRSR